MAEHDTRTLLEPQTQGNIGCHFRLYCRSGSTQWVIKRSPARPLWIHLCDRCARDMMASLPAELAGIVIAKTPGVFLSETEALPKPQSDALLTESVMAYVREHASDPAFLDALAYAVGDGEPQPPLIATAEELIAYRQANPDAGDLTIANITAADHTCPCGRKFTGPTAAATCTRHKKTCPTALAVAK